MRPLLTARFGCARRSFQCRHPAGDAGRRGFELAEPNKGPQQPAGERLGGPPPLLGKSFSLVTIDGHSRGIGRNGNYGAARCQAESRDQPPRAMGPRYPFVRAQKAPLAAALAGQWPGGPISRGRSVRLRCGQLDYNDANPGRRAVDPP